MEYDTELWEFLRAIEDTVARTWHPESPMAERLKSLQRKYDPEYAQAKAAKAASAKESA